MCAFVFLVRVLELEDDMPAVVAVLASSNGFVEAAAAEDDDEALPCGCFRFKFVYMDIDAVVAPGADLDGMEEGTDGARKTSTDLGDESHLRSHVD